MTLVLHEYTSNFLTQTTEPFLPEEPNPEPEPNIFPKVRKPVLNQLRTSIFYSKILRAATEPITVINYFV